MRNLLRLAPVLAVAALLAAGCGSGSKNDYVNSLNKATTALQKSLSGIGTDLGSGGVGPALAKKLEAGGTAIDNAADDFNGIKPPSNAKHAHGQIVDGLHKLAGTFRDAAKAARANDLSKLSQTVSGIETSAGAQEIQKAEDELKAAGYKVDGA
jgi:hypothetical protein